VNAAARARRAEALRRYSATSTPSCSCCGEATIAFLTFEHTAGGGRQQRRETGGGGFISWLLAAQRPDIEVLCMNCNHGRRVNGGVCPHVELTSLLTPTWS